MHEVAHVSDRHEREKRPVTQNPTNKRKLSQEDARGHIGTTQDRASIRNRRQSAALHLLLLYCYGCSVMHSAIALSAPRPLPPHPLRVPRPPNPPDMATAPHEAAAFGTVEEALAAALDHAASGWPA